MARRKKASVNWIFVTIALISALLLIYIVNNYQQAKNSGAAGMNRETYQTMSTPRVGHFAVTLPSGRVLVCGGAPDLGKECEFYNPAEDNWSAAPSMRYGRSFSKFVLLESGNILVAGGFTNGNKYGNKSEYYNPSTNRWISTADMNAIYGPGVSLNVLKNGKVIIIGAGSIRNKENYYVPIDSGKVVELYNPASNSWTLGETLTEPRSNHAAIVLGDGNLLVTGGKSNAINDKSGYYNSTLIFTSQEKWQKGADMNVRRAQHSMILLDDGRVLAVGGHHFIDWEYYWGWGYKGVDLNSAEIYDKGVWTLTQSMTKTMADPALIKLEDGRIFATNGSYYEIFNPVTQTWSNFTTVSPYRRDGTATYLGNKKELLTGGFDTNGTAQTSHTVITVP